MYYIFILLLHWLAGAARDNSCNIMLCYQQCSRQTPRPRTIRCRRDAL